jgi:hypothetical protein
MMRKPVSSVGTLLAFVVPAEALKVVDTFQLLSAEQPSAITKSRDGCG